MANNYTLPLKVAKEKKRPSESVLQFILNYSKSTELKKIKNESLVVHLN